MKIVMLVGDGASSKIMYNSIVKRHDVSLVIEDTATPLKVFLKRRLKKLGWFKVFGQILFVFYNKILMLVSKNRIEEIVKNDHLDLSDYPNNKFLKVTSINNKKTIKILKKEAPDLIIVNGTRIISQKVLSSVKATFVNTHVGITPKYRGVHGGYWSLVNKDYDNCGVTVHLVDKGIDTGGVLYQDLITISKKDNFNTYPYLQISKGIQLMFKVIDDFKNKKLKVIDIDKSNSKLYTHPTLGEYLINRYIKGVK